MITLLFYLASESIYERELNLKKKLNIALIPGDGIGREVMPEGVRVLEAVSSRFGIKLDWSEFEW